MATINSTPRAGLPQWGANDQVKFMTDMSTAFSDIDKKFALTGDAVIPCTATYDTATKRHTLTPTQTGITMPDIFTARFLATTAFTAGDKVYIGGAEYVTSYTDGDTAVETGVWTVGAVVSLDCKKAGLKAYVGAGFDKQFSKKADKAPPKEYDLPLASGISKWFAKNQCSYAKDQFGRVHIHASVQSTIEFGTSTLIGTLPIGYRPAIGTDVATVGAFSQNGAAYAAGKIFISDNGEIYASVQPSNHIYCVFEASFIAH